MAITGTTVTSVMLSKLQGFGWIGQYLPQFCQTVGQATPLTVIGASFTTTDIGTIRGIGSGVGQGLVIPPGVVYAKFLAEAAAAGFTGVRLPELAQALDDAVVAEGLNATLSSFHQPVFLGSATIDPGSIVVSDAVYTTQITQAGIPKGFIGPDWPRITPVMGKACTEGWKAGAGSLVITGSQTSESPSPGAGTGTGSIS